MRACAGPLEVLDFTQPMPAGTMRSVRTVPSYAEAMEGKRLHALQRLCDGGPALAPQRRGRPGLPRCSAAEADH